MSSPGGVATNRCGVLASGLSFNRPYVGGIYAGSFASGQIVLVAAGMQPGSIVSDDTAVYWLDGSGAVGRLLLASSASGHADAGGAGGEGGAQEAGPLDATVGQGADSSSGAPGDGLTNCGASLESCSTSLEVVGGSFYRTFANSGSGATGEADPATVSSFRLDKYDVTVGRFRQFVNAWNGGAGWTPPAGSGKHAHLNAGNGLDATGGSYEPGWVTSDDASIVPTNVNLACDPSYATWTDTVGPNENLPINCVVWQEAYAFCIWDGGFLPTEAEWEYAAVGGSEQREYPWGTTAPGTASQYAIYGCDYPSGSGTCTNLASIAPVGTAALGAGLWGQLDLTGNLWVWNLDRDWYGGTSGTYANPCVDCAFLSATQPPDGPPTSPRLLRGTAYNYAEPNLHPTSYGMGFPETVRASILGLRCARTP